MGSADAVLDPRSGHHRDDDEHVAVMLNALRDLSPADQDGVTQQLARVLANYEATRQIDPIVHFVESLLVTARLHRNPAYRKALAQANEDAGQGEPQGSGEVADFMAEMRARRQS